MNPDKLAQARAAGYSDAEIGNYLKASNILSNQPAPQPKKKKGGFLTRLLPTVGGALGAVGGSIVAPFFGTAAGGALGSAAGEFLRQKITGDTEGGLGNIVREGAFGAIPGVGKAAKGTVSLIRGAKAATAANAARQSAASILGDAALGGVESGQAARVANAGENISALLNNQRRGATIAQNANNEQFNRLANEAIQRQSAEASGRGIMLPDGNGILSRPAPQPSFASEGIEYRPSVSVPSAKPLSPTPQGVPLTQPPKTTATEILNPTPLTERAVSEERPMGPLSRTAERLFGRQTGIQPGAKVGSQQLSAKRAGELKDHIRTNIGSKPTDAADTILRRNESFINTKTQELNAVLDRKNAPLKPGEGSKIVAKMQKPVGVDLANNSTYNSLISEANGIKDLKGLEEFRRNVDEIINFSRSAASPDPVTERVALAARRAIDKHMAKKIPELKPIKSDLSKAFDTQTFIQHSAAAPGGFGPFGLRIGGRGAQSAAGAVSRAAEALGGVPGGEVAAGLPRQVVKAGVKQAGTRLGAEALLGTPFVGSQQPSEEPQQGNIQDVISQFGGQLPTDAGAGGQAPLSREDATIQALQILSMQAAANGDTNQANAFTAQAKMLSDQQAKQNGGLNITKVTSQQYGLAERGKSALSNLAAMLQSDPSVLAKTAIPGRGLPAVGGYISKAAGTSTYDAVSYNIADAFLRLVTGAQANESEIRDVQSKLMPRAGDPPEAQQAKLQQLQQIFDSVLNRAQNGGAGSGTDTTDALAALGY